MKKRVTRTQKYQDYREEIKNSSFSLDAQEKSNEVRSIKQTIKEKTANLTTKTQPQQSKHFLDKKEEKELEKTVYDIYQSKRRWRRFFYSLFVLIFISAIIMLFLFLGNKYLEFNLW